MRSCDECNACCVLPAIDLFNKSIREPCKFLDACCTIYETRPDVCRKYTCSWLFGVFEEDEMRPDKCGLLIDLKDTPAGTHYTVTEIWSGAANSVLGKRAIEFLAQKSIVTIGPEVGQVSYVVAQDVEALEKIQQFLPNMIMKQFI